MRTPVTALLFLVACSSHSATPAPTIEEVIVPPQLRLMTPDATPEPVVVERSLEPITAPTPRHVVTAIPSGTITRLAVTDDGDAAVTADLSGTARVWTTLDGTREPVVVAMRAPSALAITRDGDGFAIAALDAAGQLELIATKRTGESKRRLAIEAERPFVSIHAVTGGFLALGDDRVLAFVGVDGRIGERIVTETEEHLSSVAVRGAHAIAVIESGGKVHARRIERGPLRWGETSPPLAVRGEHVAITPDGKRIGGVSRNGRRMRILDLATGRNIARNWGDADFRHLQVRAVGFSDNDSLVFSDQNSSIIWWDKDGNLVHDAHGHRDVPIAAADGGAFAGAGGSVMVTTPTHQYAYVGYRMGGPLGLRAVGTHFVATDTISVLQLDHRFRMVEVHDLPKQKPAHSWYDVRVLDDRHVAASTYIDGYHALYVIDLVENELNLIVKQGYGMEYMPATRMLSYRTTNTIEIVQFDPATSTFGEPTVIGHDNRATVHFVLLDPKHADGNVAAMVEMRETTKAKVTVISKLNPVGLNLPYEVASQKDVELTEKWWRTNGDLTKLVDKSLLASPWIKSPDGTLSVAVRDQRITLRDAAGERWTIPSYSASSVLWTPGGRLIAYGAGIAELDRATGAIVTRQCGWRFGRWIEPVEGFGPAGLCEAP